MSAIPSDRLISSMQYFAINTNATISRKHTYCADKNNCYSSICCSQKTHILAEKKVEFVLDFHVLNVSLLIFFFLILCISYQSYRIYEKNKTNQKKRKFRM